MGVGLRSVTQRHVGSLRHTIIYVVTVGLVSACAKETRMYPGTFAATHPDRPAVIMAETGEGLTYRELEDSSVRLARTLAGHGLRRGDVVALLSDNHPRVFEVYWAAQRAGLLVTAVNHHLSADEAAYIVDDCGARALVVSAAKGELAEAIVPATPHVTLRLAFGGAVAGAAAPAAPRAAGGGGGGGGHRAHGGGRGGEGGGADGHPAARGRHALQLGPHRATEGDRAPPARAPDRRAGRPLHRGVQAD